jgi:hypothetical protein
MRVRNTANVLGFGVMDQFTRRIVGFAVHRGTSISLQEIRYHNDRFRNLKRS